jgi:hypothetical protein
VCKLAVHPTKRSTKPVVLAVQGMYYIVAGRLSFSLEGRRYRVNEGWTPIISSWNFEQNDDANAIVKVALIGIWHWIMIIKRLQIASRARAILCHHQRLRCAGSARVSSTSTVSWSWPHLFCSRTSNSFSKSDSKLSHSKYLGDVIYQLERLLRYRHAQGRRVML